MGRSETDSDGVTVARQLFDDETHAAICRWLDERVPVMSLGVPISDDPTEFVRTYAHNPPMLVAIHQQLADWASEQFGEPLKPSYVFLSMYRDGGRCPLHVDRPQCYRTVDYLIRQSNRRPWPIHIGRPMTDAQRAKIDKTGAGHPDTDAKIAARIKAETWTEALLRPNDAVLYSGTHQWHYRPTTLRGTADLAFFHFVPVDFDGPLD